MKRPYIPLQVKIDACLLLLGLDPKDVEWDHDPALELREKVYLATGEKAPRRVAAFYDATSEMTLTEMLQERRFYYVPDANDPRYLVPRSKAAHSTKTNGPGGEKRITTRGGDHGDAAHFRAMTKKEAAFRERLLAKAEPVRRLPVTRKRKIASRPFPKKRKTT